MKEFDVNELPKEKLKCALKKLNDLRTSILPPIARCALAVKEGQLEKQIPYETLRKMAIKDLEDARGMVREAEEMWTE